MYTQANYFAILPAAVRYNPKLSARSVLLYAALTSLAVADGTAYASNAYLANTLDVSEPTVKRLLRELEAERFIRIGFEYKNNTREIMRRLIRIAELPLLLDVPKTQALFAVVPSHILADPELSVQAKLLYAEISAATPEGGYCSKPAKFFAELLHTSEDSVRRWIRELANADAVRVEMEYRGNTAEILRRRIYLTEAAVIIEKRREIAQDNRNDVVSSIEPNTHDAPYTPQGNRILGVCKNDPTYKTDTVRKRDRHGKRKKTTERLRL